MADDPIVLLVILRPASGRKITGDSRITATTMGDFEPAVDDAAVVAGAFKAAGFVVGPLVGISFSATGPRHLVETFFGTRVSISKTGGAYAVGASGELLRELPLGVVPVEIRSRVGAATFEGPEEVL